MKNLDQEEKQTQKPEPSNVIKLLYVRTEIETRSNGPQTHQFRDAMQLGKEHLFAVTIVMSVTPYYQVLQSILSLFLY